MELVQGVGGVFFRARDAAALAAWYAKVFQLELTRWGDAHGVELPSADREPSSRLATTTLSIFQSDPKHPIGPGSFRINLRVSDLERGVRRARDAGATVEVDDDDSYGRFARLTDPEGNEIELWEPPPAD